MRKFASNVVSGWQGLVMGTLLGALVLCLGLLVYPLFPNEVPAVSAVAIIQSMIEVNGVIFAFSAVMTSILSLNPQKEIKMANIFIFLFGTLMLFFGVVFFDVLDLANMGSTLSRFILLRDVLMPIFYGLAVIYMTAETYRETRGTAPIPTHSTSN